MVFAAIRVPSARQRIGPIRLNVVQQEVIRLANVITRAPVDGEASRAQHMYTEPVSISISAIVSPRTDSPVDQNLGRYIGPNQFGPRVNAQLSLGGSLGGVSSTPGPDSVVLDALSVVSTAQFTSLNDYQSFWARIRRLNESKDTFEYTSAVGVFQDLVFSSLEVVNSHIDWIEFSAEMQTFQTVGVTRDRWLSEDHRDASMDGADTGTRTIQPSSVAEPTPSLAGTTPVSGLVQEFP